MNKIKYILCLMVVFLCVLQPSIAFSEGLGLRAGPFDFLIETATPENDVVIKISNFDTSSEWKGFNGGGYMKIAHAAPGQVIRFPRDWMYTLSLRGRNYIAGEIVHPNYVRESFIIDKRNISGESRVVICFESHFTYENTDCSDYSDSSTPLIKRKLLSFEEYFRRAKAFIRAGGFNYVSFNANFKNLDDEGVLVYYMLNQMRLTNFAEDSFYHY